MDFTGWMSVVFLTGLVATSFRVLLVAGVAVALAWVLRRRGAEVRHAIWLLVLAGMLLMPVLIAALPPLRILPTAWLGLPSKIETPMPPATGLPIVINVGSTMTVPTYRGGGPSIPAWPKVLVSVYCLIAAIAALRVANAVRRARWLVDRAQTLHDEGLRETMRLLCVAQGLGYPLPRLAQSTDAAVPFTAGWQDPVIVLPASWRAWDEYKLRAVLAHEMAHVRRGDWLIALLAALNSGLFWFHPLAWWLERKLAGLAEEACDAAAIADSGDARRYASVVLDFASVMASAGSRLSWEATAMARSSKVGGRIERILEGKMTWTKSISRGRWLALLVVALPLVYGAAALQVQNPTGGLSVSVSSQATPDGVGMPMPGAVLTDAQAQALEARVAANSDDLEARGQLLGYYFANRKTGAFVKELSWLVEHHPESPIHEQFPSNFALSPATIPDGETRKTVVALWARKAAENPANANVLMHAASVVSSSDPAAAFAYLKQASLAEPGDARVMGRLIGMYAIATARKVNNRTTGPWDAFGDAVSRELDASTDAQLLARLGQQLASQRLPPTKGMSDSMAKSITDRWLKMHEAGLKYLDRAMQLDPGNEEWKNIREALSKPQPMELAQVAPLTVLANRGPEYPPLALQARIQGPVTVDVHVNAEGLVESAKAVDGHPLLRIAAEDCVRNWRYSPQRANGKAVEADTQAVVNFHLPAVGGVEPARPAGTAVPTRISVGGNIQKQVLLSSAEPEYPPLAKQARIQGMVRFEVVLGRDGKVSNLKLVSGHPLLVQSAVQAVRQYTYRPTLLNGEPVEVATTVDVPFTLSQ
ncbi:M56 family metallopeptidase [uncultured Paludibaculum sp.]|uniref:M56 family metallopeptidase n=1 Tax=uncultured Paludibaculum sp. TaxID=1765020 RepID=UPI002AAC06B5|nr:M56 family metallopeptidase [uncultured Paludibaculum sp.]